VINTWGVTSANGASDALGMGPSAGYILFSSLCQFIVFMCYVVSVTFYMPWMFVYVILMFAGMFRLSCLYVFNHDLGSYMIYITLLLYLFCLILVHMKMLIILFIFMWIYMMLCSNCLLSYMSSPCNYYFSELNCVENYLNF
jgi:hypothetical protein